MPLFQLALTPGIIEQGPLRRIQPRLQLALARGLCTGFGAGVLLPHEVEIQVRTYTDLDCHSSDFMLTSLAVNAYWLRTRNIQQRAEQVAREIREMDILPPSITGTHRAAVHLALGRGGFAFI